MTIYLLAPQELSLPIFSLYRPIRGFKMHLGNIYLEFGDIWMLLGCFVLEELR